MFPYDSLSLNKRSSPHWVFHCACILAGFFVFATSVQAMEWEGDEKLEVLEAFVAGEYDNVIGNETVSSAMTAMDFAPAAVVEISNSAIVPIYAADFSSDPNWITDDANNFYWQASTSALFVKAQTFSPTHQPNRYFVTETELDPTRSFTLEADIKILEFDRSGVVIFGLYADDLRSSNQVGAGMPRSSGTLNVELFQLNGNSNFWENNIVDKDQLNLGGGGITSPPHALNTWYHAAFTYDAETGTVTMLVTNKETGELHRARTRTGVNFNPNMRFLGVAVNPEGLTGTNMSFANDLGGSASFLIDNVVLNQVVENSAPEISNLGQFKMFGEEPIGEGDTFIGNTAVFKAEVADPDGDDAQLEIELISTGDGTSQSYLSETVSSGTTISVTVDELIPKDKHYEPGGNEQSFRWRARAIDSNGVASEWQEFGSPDNTDFTNKVVPLFTQRQSEFPSQIETQAWFDQPYAAGRGNEPSDPERCGPSIIDCGCGITSAVMIAQYYGIYESVDGENINPLTLNAYLLAHGGYDAFGNIMGWGSVLSNYFGERHVNGNIQHRLTFVDSYTLSQDIVNQQLVELAPVINRSVAKGHFNVIDGQAGATYTVRDPLWYKTKTLNDVKEFEGGALVAQAYNNTFNKARLAIHHREPVLATSQLYFTLASPAELVVTDPGGNRIGTNPVIDEGYEEISGASYECEYDIVSSEDDIDETDYHCTKVVHVPNPVAGQYTVQVIGTGEGDYSLTSLLVSPSGEVGQSQATATVRYGEVNHYNAGYDPENPVETELEVAEAQELETLLAHLRIVAETIVKPGVRSSVLVLIQQVEHSLQKGQTTLVKLTLLDLMIAKLSPKHISQTVANELHATIDKIKELLKQ